MVILHHNDISVLRSLWRPLVDAIGIEEIGRALSPSQPLGAKLPLDVGIGETGLFELLMPVVGQAMRAQCNLRWMPFQWIHVVEPDKQLQTPARAIVVPMCSHKILRGEMRRQMHHLVAMKHCMTTQVGRNG